MYIVSIMGKIAIVLICCFRVFAKSYPCCPRTFGTALVQTKMTIFVRNVGGFEPKHAVFEYSAAFQVTYGFESVRIDVTRWVMFTQKCNMNMKCD